MDQIPPTPDSTLPDSIGNRVCVIVLAILWHQVLWGAALWIFYYVVPVQKMILRDFEIEIHRIDFIVSIIRVSDFVVIHYHFVPLLLVIIIAIDSAAMSFLFKKPVRRMLWFLCMSALPFFAFVYGVFGVYRAFEFMAFQLAWDPRFLQ